MTERTHGFEEDIEGKALQAIEIADRAFMRGAEVAIVQYTVGAEEADPWWMACRVWEAVCRRIGSSKACTWIANKAAFGPTRLLQGENLRGHFEIRRARP